MASSSQPPVSLTQLPAFLTHTPPASPGTDHAAVSPQSGITMRLADEELWKAFHANTTEMIVMKHGRKIFPKLAVVVDGLDPDALYTFTLHMQPVGCNRLKFADGEWQSTKDSVAANTSNTVTHHDNAQNGAFWMKRQVNFDQVKLTNKPQADGGSEISLCSMQRYQPVVRVVRYAGADPIVVSTFAPECTQFITVTAYNNPKIINLKVGHNPFARSRSSRKRRQPEGASDNALTPAKRATNNAPLAERPTFETFCMFLAQLGVAPNAFLPNPHGMPFANEPLQLSSMMQQFATAMQEPLMPPSMMPFSWSLPQVEPLDLRVKKD
ncbi:Protein TBX-9 [Aphelenchoides avenae]|nr:Protein TBX-9 [Aphelenchus avenae]